MASFEITDNTFALDGEPFRILSGTIHYFRVPKEYWADRIHKARLMGLNTIETYVPWNLHEPVRGEWDASGRLDLGGFLDTVQAEGMRAIVRPGPYICAEFDGGGLPGWLFRDAPPVAHLDNRLATGHAPVRTLAPSFMEPASNYLRRVYDIVAPRQITRGGPVILVQIENEYGAYGSDHAYIQALTDLTRGCGIEVPLTTVDQPAGTMLEDGSLPELLVTGSFGSRAAERLAKLREVQSNGPLMCAEFWDGWFDGWSEYHHTTDPSASAAELEAILAQGASVNLYMFHGGTNFGLTNGANDKGQFRAITTSYDYDAPLDETGHPTAKYWAYRDVLGRFTQLPDEVPTERQAGPVRSGMFSAAVPLGDVADQLGQFQSAGAHLTMDSIGQFQGLARYRCIFDDDESSAAVPSALISGGTGSGVSMGLAAGRHIMSVGEVRDRAIVHINGHRAGVLERMDHDHVLAFDGAARQIDILIEDMGRINYGPRIGEHKGLIGPVLFDGKARGRWEIAPVNLDDLGPVLGALRPLPGAALAALAADHEVHVADEVNDGGEVAVGNGLTVTDPAFVSATITLPEPCDLFLDTCGWGHGFVWFNGNLLGRYNRRGPQRTLYVPAPYVRAGGNELLVLELDPVVDMRWALVEEPDLGPIDW